MPHTPGPWQAAYVGGRDWIIYDSQCDKAVADLNFWEEDSFPEDVTCGNARLIAQAPEMYALLKKIEFVEDGVTTWCPYCGENPPEHSKGCRLAAVLKAVENADAGSD